MQLSLLALTYNLGTVVIICRDITDAYLITIKKIVYWWSLIGFLGVSLVACWLLGYIQRLHQINWRRSFKKRQISISAQLKCRSHISILIIHLLLHKRFLGNLSRCPLNQFLLSQRIQFIICVFLLLNRPRMLQSLNLLRTMRISLFHFRTSCGRWLRQLGYWVGASIEFLSRIVFLFER